MSLIWDQINSVSKIIIGFIIGFTTFFAGVILDKKGYTGESRILLGAWILINYLVILAWRYLIWDNYWEDTGTLWIGITFLFLILNTIFAILTSLLYKSKTILIFAFIFAYLNPLLTWGNSATPYILIGYSMIVSVWALFIWIKQKSSTLIYAAFILWNILFLIAPFETEFGWIAKLISSAILWATVILSTYKNDSKSIATIFILNYIFIILQLITWWDNWVLSHNISFIMYMISILLFFWIWIWLFMIESLKSIIPLLLLPILIILWLVFSWNLILITSALAIMVLAYLFGFNFLETKLPVLFKYIFFIILWLFIFSINSFLSFNSNIENNFVSFLIITIVSFVFMFTAYALSRKKGLEYLYSIWTIWWILTLMPLSLKIVLIFLEPTWTIGEQYIITTWIISIIPFALANWIIPFINNNLTKKSKNLKNLIIWSILGMLYISSQLFQYGNEYFPWIALWFAFAGLAVAYFILGGGMLHKLEADETKQTLAPRNTILSYLFISISLLSLAIALVFSNNPEVISTIWLFEATILFYFFSKAEENKIFTAWIILFTIWIVKLFSLEHIVEKGDLIFLIPFSIIFISLMLNVKFLNKTKNLSVRIIHDILHIIWIWVLGFLLVKIIPTTWYGWSTLWISIFVLIIWSIYAYFNSKILKTFFIIALSWAALSHLEWFNSIMWNIDNENLSYLRVLQYTSTAILASLIVSWNKFNKEILLWNIVKWIVAIYIFLIVSFYVYDIFNTTFAVTIFWWIISSILLFYGIAINKIKFRTTGLYILSIVLAKIFIYDIWYWLDDAITRVIALMVIWILLIIISLQYSKKYGNNLKWEFKLWNLNDTLNDTVKKEIKQEWNLNKKIEDIDIEWIKSIKFEVNGDKGFSTTAKNLLKIVMFVKTNTWKTEFQPWELSEIYSFITKNYKSELSKRDYEKVKTILKNFVAKWGKIEVVEY
jgi:hypothetical protein